MLWLIFMVSGCTIDSSGNCHHPSKIGVYWCRQRCTNVLKTEGYFPYSRFFIIKSPFSFIWSLWTCFSSLLCNKQIRTSEIYFLFGFYGVGALRCCCGEYVPLWRWWETLLPFWERFRFWGSWLMQSLSFTWRNQNENFNSDMYTKHI